MECPDEDVIAAFVARRLAEDERAQLMGHADACAGCRRAIAAAVGALSPTVGVVSSSSGAAAVTPSAASDSTLPHRRLDAVTTLSPGESVGRYRILHILGAGGMGVVYAAFDPELQRRVALKLVRNEFPGLDDELRARLTREAQAMARIRHANVISVFDVGSWRGQLFVAMEAIDGWTLASWQRREPRSVAETLRVVAAAGRGLAAAHAAGLVHRDFKPDNVLIGEDGRVCVTDFGLARAPSLREAETATPPGGDSGPWTLALTHAGAAVGTPAYMAPEQMRGEPPDERADQFSFCVALFEALYGVRPYPGRTMKEIERSILAGERERPRRRGVPRAVQRALERGLSPTPDARFPSMEALLAALDDRSRRRVTVAAAGAALLAVAGVGWHQQMGARNAQVCRGAARRLDGVWDDARRAAIMKALGPTVGHRVAVAFDAYAAAWTRAHTDACEATHVRGEQSEALLDLRMQCLDDRRADLDEAARLLTSDHGAARRAAELAQTLPPLAACADTRALQRPRRPAVAAEKLEPIRRQLARARAKHRADDCRGALADATAAVKAARDLAADDLAAEGELDVGLAQRCLGQDVAARASFIEAAVGGARAQDDVLVTETSDQLIHLDAEQRAWDDADRWVRTGGEAVQAVDDEREIAKRLTILANLAWHRQHLEEAYQLYAQAEEHYVRAGADDRDYERCISLGSWATALSDSGRFDEAAAIYRRILPAFVETLGAEHEVTLSVTENLAIDEWQRGDDAAGIAGERRYIEHIGDAFPCHSANALGNYGWMLVYAGHPDEAMAQFRRALAFVARIDGDRAAPTAYAESGIGAALLALHRPEEARPYLERALAAQHSDDDEADDRAQTAFVLAQALPPREQTRAIGLARDAERYLASHQLGARSRQRLDMVRAWLRAHDAS